jgi:hypothetical protein
MPVEAQSDSLAVGLTATASDSGSSAKKRKRSKINIKRYPDGHCHRNQGDEERQVFVHFI